MLLKECIRKGEKSDTKVRRELRLFTKVFEELTISDGGLIMRGERVVLPHSLICRAIEKKTIKEDIQENSAKNVV